MVFQRNCARCRTGHMIKKDIFGAFIFVFFCSLPVFVVVVVVVVVVVQSRSVLLFDPL